MSKLQENAVKQPSRDDCVFYPMSGVCVSNMEMVFDASHSIWVFVHSDDSDVACHVCALDKTPARFWLKFQLRAVMVFRCICKGSIFTMLVSLLFNMFTLLALKANINNN